MALRDIRPYMLHAHIQWLQDSEEIPHIMILNGPGVVFPQHLRDAPHLLFNVSSEACQGLDINDDGVSFSGRFGGRIFKVEAPLDAVVTVQNKAVTFMVSFAKQEDMVADQALNEQHAPLLPRLSLVASDGKKTEQKAPVQKRGLHLVKGTGKKD